MVSVKGKNGNALTGELKRFLELNEVTLNGGGRKNVREKY